jgi:3-oxoacyl-[acyl-carrier protein] reductase
MIKNVIVTGSNGGIGVAVVEKFLKNNYNVFAHYHRSNNNLNQIKSKHLVKIQADLSNLKECKELFGKCLNSSSNLDALINNAGTMILSEDIEFIKIEDYDYVMNLNLKAPFILSQCALNKMRKQKYGRIVNISSIGVKYGGNPTSATYTISKSALETLTVLFAKSGTPSGILVNTIRAGLTNTKFLEYNPKKNISERVKLIPAQRMAEPFEIAESVFFLGSELNTYISGSVLTVSGGE